MGIERAMFHLTYLLAITGTSTSRKLDGFRTLADGWHYGNGGPIAEEQIREAKKMLQFMNMIGFTRTDAFASGDGETIRRDPRVQQVYFGSGKTFAAAGGV